MEVGGQFEVGEATVEDVYVEAGVKGTVDAHILLQCDGGQVILLGHEVDVLQHVGHAEDTSLAVDGDVALAAKQSADEVEQRRLACTVLAQQAVDAARLQG